MCLLLVLFVWFLEGVEGLTDYSRSHSIGTQEPSKSLTSVRPSREIKQGMSLALAGPHGKDLGEKEVAPDGAPGKDLKPIPGPGRLLT